MKRFRVLSALLAILVFSAFVFAGSEKADESLTKLQDGNRRFVNGALAYKDMGDAKRKELAKGQKPFAIVVTCSDSRVAPELLFDQGLGEIFVVRVAGNVVDPIAIGSIEYAAEHLGSSLIIVLGHEKCGAVAAALDLKGKPEGNIGAILKKIMPAVKTAKKKGGTKDEILDAAVQENVKNTSSEIMKKSKIVKELVHEGKLKIVTGEYSLTTGSVAMLESADPGCHQPCAFQAEHHGK